MKTESKKIIEHLLLLGFVEERSENSGFGKTTSFEYSRCYTKDINEYTITVSEKQHEDCSFIFEMRDSSIFDVVTFKTLEKLHFLMCKVYFAINVLTARKDGIF